MVAEQKPDLLNKVVILKADDQETQRIYNGLL